MLINLILWEKENGLKARWVAEKLNCDEAKYSRIKNGKQLADVEFLHKFSEVFGNTISDGNVLKLFLKNNNSQ